MKGTLFSADFAKDRDNNLRLLELNTDTAFTSGALSNVSYTELFNVISSSNISEVHVIYKDVYHGMFVNDLSASIAASDQISVTFNKYKEDINTIYPTSVEDASNKFILRCAYDESAIFDSTYCKEKDEVHKLFHDNSNSGSVSEIYLTGSDGLYDNLHRDVNSALAPDFAVKNLDDVHESLSFYKVKGTGSAAQNIDAFIDGLPSSSMVINYYNDDTETSHKGYRAFNIIYGSELDLINLANVEVSAVLDKPTAVSYDNAVVNNLINKKHYYEFTSNYPSFDGYGGIFESDEIVDSSGNAVAIEDTVIGNTYRSTFISGSPDSDNIQVFTQWSYPGSSLPAGSYVTSSVLVNKISQDLPNNIIYHIQTADNSSFRVSANQHMLVYDSGSDQLQYKDIHHIDINNDKLLSISGSTVDIASKDIEILDGNHKTYILDMESEDTFTLYNGELNVKIITHNCFPAGTKILLEGGLYKNIEDITTQDVLLTYNNDKKEYGLGKVGSIRISTQSKLIKINTEKEELKSTPRHKIFTSDGWKAAEEVAVGDSLFNKEGELVEVLNIEVLDGEFEVYHLIDVKDNHTYFAEDLLVHNIKAVPSCFVAGTEILLSNGDVKNIEDVAVGETVLSYNVELKENEEGIVGELKQHEVDSTIRLTLDNEIILVTTDEHPFYVIEKGWVKAKDIEPLDVCLKEDGSEALVSTKEIIEGKVEVFNLLNVSDNHNFYANRILVHNK